MIRTQGSKGTDETERTGKAKERSGRWGTKITDKRGRDGKIIEANENQTVKTLALDFGASFPVVLIHEITTVKGIQGEVPPPFLRLPVLEVLWRDEYETATEALAANGHKLNPLAVWSPSRTDATLIVGPAKLSADEAKLVSVFQQAADHAARLRGSKQPGCVMVVSDPNRARPMGKVDAKGNRVDDDDPNGELVELSSISVGSVCVSVEIAGFAHGSEK